MHRGDTEAGGAADLQTDIMRFMAILALCLVAIFALVQSIPLIPETPATSTAAAAPPLQVPQDEPAATVVSEPPKPAPVSPPEATPPERNVVLTRPKWETTFVPQQSAMTLEVTEPPEREAELKPTVSTDSPPATPSPPPTEPADRGFSLRFESDQALTRLVAAGKVGLYAIDGGRAKRMTISESRISFWDASTPNAFHEMEVSTVPGAVIDALTRTGTDSGSVDWGVTLPGKLSQQLSALMQANDGGDLVIGVDGELRLEDS